MLQHNISDVHDTNVSTNRGSATVAREGTSDEKSDFFQARLVEGLGEIGVLFGTNDDTAGVVLNRDLEIEF